jgi:hypothetical protein
MMAFSLNAAPDVHHVMQAAACVFDLSNTPETSSA